VIHDAFAPTTERSALDSLAPACGKLVVLVRALEGGGAQRDAILLANALAAADVPVTILTLCAQGSLKNLVDPCVPIVDVPGKRMRHAVMHLRRTIDALRPQLILSSEAGLNLFCLAAVRSLPRDARPKVILREVSSPSIALKHGTYWQNRLAYRVLRYAYRYADLIITLTDAARRDLIANFATPACKVATMSSNAVITPQAAERIRHWDGETGREPDLIASVARLAPEKNHQLLLTALARIGTGRPWRLAIMGDGPERARLIERTKTLGLTDRVKFVGYVDDPYPWLMRARVAVCTSHHEGLCNTIIEALACGTPVVSTDCPVGPREILQSGRYGTLVPTGDPGALSAAILHAMDAPIDRAHLMARAHNYTTKRAADCFLKIISDMLPTSPPARTRNSDAKLVATTYTSSI
jgi:glycosyltransferase involved in cell wall biosynthesis